MLADFPADVVTRLLVSSGEHGYQALDADLLSSLSEAAEWRRRKRQVTFELNFGPLTVWEGRLEDKLINLGGWSAGALGYWRALRDVLYTAVFSDTRLEPWELVPSEDIAAARPGLYQTDKLNRLMAQIRKGETYNSGTDKLIWAYKVPNLGQRKINRLVLPYDYNLPVGGLAWTLVVRAYNEGFASGATIHTFTTTGGTAAGTLTLSSFTSKDFVTVEFFNSSGIAAAPTGQTGTYYVKLTGPRVMTVNASEIHADDIAGALLGYVTGINASQLSAATALIEDPGVDLELELYEEQRPADILTDLAGRGDDQTPPRKWEVGVRDQRLLYFRPKGAVSRTWHVEAADLALESTLDEVVNSVYSVYRGTDGRTMRTAAATDSNSQNDFGLTRQDVVRARTTSAAKSTTERDAALAAGANPPPRAARLTFDQVTTAAGAGVPLWMVEPGDILVVENLPVELLADPDEINSFRLAATEFDPLAGEGGRLNVRPESLPPTLEAYLSLTTARAANEAAADIRT
jgi:hypothetical protein